MKLLPMPISILWLRFLAVVSAACMLSGCGTPGGAPVVSRDSVSVKSAQSKSLSRASHYRVKPGDTLYAIAWEAGVDYKKLAKWNQIRYPYTIHPGQRLRLTASVLSVQKNASATNKSSQSLKQQKTSTASQKRKKRLTKPSNKQNGAAKGIKPPPSLERIRKLKWHWPTNGKVVQSFSRRDSTKKGLRIRGRFRQSVRAAESGRVVYSGSGLIGYGPLIIIKHDRNYLSAYGYNHKLLVAEGDNVTKGERIAEMGNATDGKPSLHFEIRRGGKPVDPAVLLPKR